MKTRAYINEKPLERKVEYILFISDIEEEHDLGIKLTANDHRELVDEIRRTFFPFLTSHEIEQLTSPNYKTESERKQQQMEKYLKDWDEF